MSIENTLKSRTNPPQEKESESQSNFVDSLLKVLSHPLFVGAGGYFLGQYFSGKNGGTDGTQLEKELSEIKTELKKIADRLSVSNNSNVPNKSSSKTTIQLI